MPRLLPPDNQHLPKEGEGKDHVCVVCNKNTIIIWLLIQMLHIPPAPFADQKQYGPAPVVAYINVSEKDILALLIITKKLNIGDKPVTRLVLIKVFINS